MMNNETAEFLGWYFGDGCISITGNRYEFAITGDITEEREFYKQIIVPTLNKIFYHKLGRKIELKLYPSVGVCGIYLFDRTFVRGLLAEFDLKPGKKIDVNIPYFKTINQKKHFLRGLFDTDGSIYFCKSNVKTKNPTFCTTFHYKPKIKLATISKIIIERVFKMLLELGFSPRLYSPRKQRPHENIMYSVVLDTNKNIEKWIKEIGFRNPKHSTKIAVWKKQGYCPPYTTIKDRIAIINREIKLSTPFLK